MMWFDSLVKLNPDSASYKKLAEFQNNLTFQNTFQRLLNDALHRYQFENLPETVSERVVRMALTCYGSVFFFQIENNLVALPGAPDGSGINVYGDYAGAWVYGANGYNERIGLYIEGADNSSLIAKTITNGQPKKIGFMVRESDTTYPFINYVIQYAEAIADAYRTLDVARQNIKRPYIITTPESNINTIKKYFEHVNNNEPFIISSGSLPTDSITVQPLDINVECTNAASQLIDWYEQKYRELCGYENMGGQIDKKGENLNSMEITYNDEYTDASLEHRIISITEGLDFMNKTLGTNITVKKEMKNDDIQRNDREESGDVSDDSDTRTESDDL